MCSPLDACYGSCGAGRDFDVYDHPTDYTRLVCHFKASWHRCAKFLKNDVVIHADDAGEGATHADISDVRSALGKDFFVGGLDMGVSADNCSGTTISVESKSHFFTGRFSVEIDESVLGLDLFI